jgi:Tol biopolymer transport system component
MSLVLVTLGTAIPAGAAFPGTNGLIAFQTPDGIGVAAPGGEPTLLGPPATRSGFRFPAWSADGTRLAFIRNSRVCVMDADGTHVRCIGEKGTSTEWPTWSHDNSTVVFARKSDVWSVNVDALAPVAVNLTGTGRFNEGNPVVSPDGSLVAYERSRAGSRSRIFVMGPDGSDPHALTDTALSSRDPEWSPDGTHILFQLYLDAATNVLAVMEADGDDRQVIFERSVSDAVYSPDGERIAFTRLTGPNLIPRIWGIHADGSHLTRLVSDSDGGHYFFPSWQPVTG